MHTNIAHALVAEVKARELDRCTTELGCFRRGDAGHQKDHGVLSGLLHHPFYFLVRVRYYELEDQLPSQSLGTSISQLDAWQNVSSGAYDMSGGPRLSGFKQMGDNIFQEQLLNGSQKGTLADKLRETWQQCRLADRRARKQSDCLRISFVGLFCG